MWRNSKNHLCNHKHFWKLNKRFVDYYSFVYKIYSIKCSSAHSPRNATSSVLNYCDKRRVVAILVWNWLAREFSYRTWTMFINHNEMRGRQVKYLQKIYYYSDWKFSLHFAIQSDFQMKHNKCSIYEYLLCMSNTRISIKLHQIDLNLQVNYVSFFWIFLVSCLPPEQSGKASISCKCSKHTNYGSQMIFFKLKKTSCRSKCTGHQQY